MKDESRLLFATVVVSLAGMGAALPTRAVSGWRFPRDRCDAERIHDLRGSLRVCVFGANSVTLS